MSGLSGLFEEELERLRESWKERVLGWRGGGREGKIEW